MRQARIQVYFFDKRDRYLVRDAIRDRFAPKGSSLNIELYLLDPCSPTEPEQCGWLFWLPIGNHGSPTSEGEYTMDRGKARRRLQTLYGRMGGTIVSSISYRDEQGSFEIPYNTCPTLCTQGTKENRE